MWSSTDGITWPQETSSAGFTGRSYHSSVTFEGEMWVIGGVTYAEVDLNDVWHSANGATWTRATAAADFSTRESHSSVVYNNKMWVMEGASGSSLTSKGDVWYTQ